MPRTRKPYPPEFREQLVVVDEVQQFIGEKIQRAMDVQEIAEHCCTTLNQRLLLIGTGQSALNTTPSLQRLQARFKVSVQLSDTDVESVIRKTVLRKKPERETAISKCLDANQGELARHLENTRFAANHDDDKFFVADYPLLPTRRRFWEKVLRNTDHSGAKAQLRSQLVVIAQGVAAPRSASRGGREKGPTAADVVRTGLRAMRFRSTYARHRIRHGIRHTAALAGRRSRRCVANGRLRHMLIGYARVSKADGSQSLDLQRDALRAEGVDAGNVYHDVASGVRDDRPDSTAACAP